MATEKKYIAIRVQNLSKRYQIGHLHKNRTFVEEIQRTISTPYRRVRNVLTGRTATAQEEGRTMWALRDVSFDVARGEVIGVIGRNGAGKSTLLKILSRITPPTEGYARINGRVGSLLEVGTGFHPELTGRENVFLNGAILGMKRHEIARKFDEIVAFSEVEDFIDTPVKFYSSGMYLRLAFSVAAHLEPEILIVDEVLAVGDTSFQRKSIGKMQNIAGEGRTVLFVSHNLGAVSNLCDRCVMLHKGTVRMIGDTESVVNAYLSAGIQAEGEKVWGELDKQKNPYLHMHSVRVLNSDTRTVTASYDMRKPITIELTYDVLKPMRPSRLMFRLFNSDGTLIFTASDESIAPTNRQPGRYTVECTIPGGLLNSGSYTVSVLGDFPGIQNFFHEEHIVRFHTEAATGEVDRTQSDRLPGVIRPQNLVWRTVETEPAR
jgi:lipopolysaccharide transport system ATP-binding protein